MGGGLSKRPNSAEIKKSPLVHSNSDLHKKVSVEEEPIPNPPEMYKEQSELEKRVVSTLKTMNKKRLADGTNKGVMNRVLLNFPRMATTFSELYRLYSETDTDNSGALEFPEVFELMKRLNPGIEEEVCKEIFAESDVCTDGQINFKEFLTCLALGYILDLIPGLKSDAPEGEFTEGAKGEEVFKDKKGVRRVFELATEMYLAFDNTCTGTVTFQEMEAVINSTTGQAEMTKKTLERRNSLTKVHRSGKQRKRSIDLHLHGHVAAAAAASAAHADGGAEAGGASQETDGNPMVQLLSKDRWKELDWDSDGYITYQEFIYTFVKWVSSLNSDKEEEDD